MAHKKAGGSSRNGRDLAGRRLGVKKFGGQQVIGGMILYANGERNFIPAVMSVSARTIRCSPPPPERSHLSEKATDANTYRYARLALQNKSGEKTRTPLRRQAPADVLEDKFRDEIERPKSLLIRPVSPRLTKGTRSPRPLRRFRPRTGRFTGDFMFPDMARDDVFRLETPRLWLRWPRICDAAAIHKFCSQWEVARYTARIPHPYPPGSAERFIYASREANASGRDLTLVITPIKGKGDAIGSISLEICAAGTAWLLVMRSRPRLGARASRPRRPKR